MCNSFCFAGLLSRSLIIALELVIFIAVFENAFWRTLAALRLALALAARVCKWRKWNGLGGSGRGLSMCISEVTKGNSSSLAGDCL